MNAILCCMAQSTTEEYSPPPKTTPELSTMQTSPGYSIGSSSGYSSPRSSNDSKSPTPEPLSNHAADISAESGQTSQSSLNVTVIRIDPGATSNHIWVLQSNWFRPSGRFKLGNLAISFHSDGGDSARSEARQPTGSFDAHPYDAIETPQPDGVLQASADDPKEMLTRTQ